MTADEMTVLVPLDGSPLAEAVLPWAAQIGRALNATLILAGVTDRDSASIGGVRRTVHASDAFVIDPLLDYLETKTAALRAEGLAVRLVIRAGDPADRILAIAARHDVFLIVMATHGRGGLQRLRLGSVADNVMRRSERPVLLIRPSEPAGREQVAIKRLMVPLDGSGLAESALPFACTLAEALDGTLLLVQAVPHVETDVGRYSYLPDLRRMEEASARDAQDYLESVRDHLPAGTRADVIVLRGFPPESLESFVRDGRADLVVMTTHGRGGFRRLLLGSTADHLIRAGVPAVLLRPTATVPEAAQFEARTIERDAGNS